MLLSAASPLVQTLKSAHFSVIPSAIVSSQDTGEQSELSSRLTAFSISNSMNDVTASALFTFAVGQETQSLSPLMGRSVYDFVGRPMLDPNLNLVLNLEVRNGAGASVGSLTVLQGRIDRINAAASKTTLTVQCRDIGARYLNRTISRATQYGSTGGTAVETVMANILATNGFSGAPDLYVPVSPGFQVTDFFTGEISVLESLRILAQQIGWDVRHFTADQSALRLYDPGRGRLLWDDSITPYQYSALTDLSIGDEDVRNYWEVFYPDCVTPAIAQDAMSIARYGLRYARIGEDRALNIRTEPAAQVLANSALADTKDPFASHEIRMPLYPVVQLNDLHQYYGFQVDANGVLIQGRYDQDLTLAVVGYRHDWKAGPGMPTTTIQARGQPIAAYREYRKSVEPRVLASLTEPNPTRYAPEGTVWFQVDDLTPP